MMPRCPALAAVLVSALMLLSAWPTPARAAMMTATADAVNGMATFRDLDVDNNMMNPSTDLTPHDCTHEPLMPVKF